MLSIYEISSITYNNNDINNNNNNNDNENDNDDNNNNNNNNNNDSNNNRKLRWRRALRGFLHERMPQRIPSLEYKSFSNNCYLPRFTTTEKQDHKIKVVFAVVDRRIPAYS